MIASGTIRTVSKHTQLLHLLIILIFIMDFLIDSLIDHILNIERAVFTAFLPFFSYRSAVSDLQIAYTVEWKDPWEPFYIAPNHIPLYDERFKQVCDTNNRASFNSVL